MPRLSKNTFSFTKQKLESLKPDNKDIYYHDSVESGLILIVRSSGAKTFWLRYYMNGREMKFCIGAFKDISIENARKVASSHKNNMNQGINPKMVQKSIANEPTIKDLCLYYVERHIKKYTKASGYEEKDLKRYFYKFYNQKASEITTEMIDDLHTKIKNEGYITKANKTLQIIKTVYNFAIKTNYYTGKNPAIGIQMFRETSRTRIIQESEFELFFKSMQMEHSRDVKDFFMIALLTGVRKGNILEMKWRDIDFDNSTPFWMIDRTKNGEPHVAVLIPILVDILKSRKKFQEEMDIVSEFVFVGTGKSGHLEDVKRAKKRIIDRAGIKDLRVHDFRRTVATFVSDGGANTLIVKDILGHSNGDVTSIYARTQLATKHQVLLNTWNAMSGLIGKIKQWW